jgi:F-type H+-transporting ATPase subunit b
MSIANLVVLGAAESGFDPLRFDPSAFVLTVVTFLGLLLILSKVAWKPIITAVEAREKRIDDAITKAETDRQAAAKLLEDHKRTVANVESEVAALRERGRLESEALRRDIVGKAQQEAVAAAEKARRDIELARQQAVQDIRREAVTLGIAVAGKVVGRSLDGEDQRRLANEVVGNLTAVGRSEN